MKENIKTEILEISNIKVPLAREFILEEDNITWLMNGFDSLKKLSFDFNDEKNVKEAEKLRTSANKFIKNFKGFCDPLEEEGKSIAKTRSRVKLKLESVIDEILKPIDDLKEKLRDIRGRMVMKPVDIRQADERLTELQTLKDFNWLSSKKEALEVIDQFEGLTLLHKNRMLEEKKMQDEAAEKARLIREEEIRQQASIKAKADAQKEIDAANKKAEEAVKEVKLIRAVQEPIKLPTGIDPTEHKRKIHNEILLDLSEVFSGNEEEAKKIISAIAKGSIRHLTIKY